MIVLRAGALALAATGVALAADSAHPDGDHAPLQNRLHPHARGLGSDTLYMQLRRRRLESSADVRRASSNARADPADAVNDINWDPLGIFGGASSAGSARNGGSSSSRDTGGRSNGGNGYSAGRSASGNTGGRGGNGAESRTQADQNNAQRQNPIMGNLPTSSAQSSERTGGTGRQSAGARSTGGAGRQSAGARSTGGAGRQSERSQDTQRATSPSRAGGGARTSDRTTQAAPTRSSADARTTRAPGRTSADASTSQAGAGGDRTTSVATRTAHGTSTAVAGPAGSDVTETVQATATAKPPPPSPPPPEKDNHTGLIAGVSVAGGVVLLALLGVAAYMLFGGRIRQMLRRREEIRWPELRQEASGAAPLPARQTGGAGFDMGDESDDDAPDPMMHEVSVKPADSFSNGSVMTAQDPYGVARSASYQTGANGVPYQNMAGTGALLAQAPHADSYPVPSAGDASHSADASAYGAAHGMDYSQYGAPPPDTVHDAYGTALGGADAGAYGAGAADAGAIGAGAADAGARGTRAAREDDVDRYAAGSGALHRQENPRARRTDALYRHETTGAAAQAPADTIGPSGAAGGAYQEMTLPSGGMPPASLQAGMPLQPLPAAEEASPYDMDAYDPSAYMADTGYAAHYPGAFPAPDTHM
ncbi:hypothetical protein MSPP1_003673 [Malassezia sp. CBS 17886]|nr:hypothetical protein MSPP1_003673 [Malassezia sp. CBS 17886]